MPQQALHYFGVVVVLTEQGGVGVAQGVPSLNLEQQRHMPRIVLGRIEKRSRKGKLTNHDKY
jgi:hypothetical protein